MRLRNALAIIFVAVMTTSCAKSPSLELSPERVELGVLMPSESVADTIWIINRGDAPLEVTVRSGCDCIEFEGAVPDTIAPGDSAAIAWVYYAPDTEKTEKKSILLSTNDPEHKVVKIEFTGIIRGRRLSISDSTITLLPIFAPSSALRSAADKLMKGFFAKARGKLGLPLASPVMITEHIISDRNYGKRPLDEVMRKWALVDSIRYVVACQMKPKGSARVSLTCELVDGFFKFPISFRLSADTAGAADSLIAKLGDIFENWGEYRKRAMMEGFQRKWAQQRRQIIGKPLPKMELKDVLSGHILTADSACGKALVLHFFSIDCEHCEEEIEWLTRLVESHPQGVLVWGVSVDLGEEDKVEDFARKRNLPYPIVMPTKQSHRRFTRIYGGATPQTIVADQRGVVVEFFVGFNKVLMNRLEALLAQLTRGR